MNEFECGKEEVAKLKKNIISHKTNICHQLCSWLVRQLVAKKTKNYLKVYKNEENSSENMTSKLFMLLPNYLVRK